jgi:hypothetical protein
MVRRIYISGCIWVYISPSLQEYQVKIDPINERCSVLKTGRPT